MKMGFIIPFFRVYNINVTVIDNRFIMFRLRFLKHIFTFAIRHYY